MTQSLTIDGRALVPITEEIAALARVHLPALPDAPGVRWISVRLPHAPLYMIDTCWVATYDNEAMQQQDFAGWECLNRREEMAL